MKETSMKTAGVAAMGAALALGAAATPMIASAAAAPAADAPQAVEAAVCTQAFSQVKVAEVAGTFAFDQTQLTSNADIRRDFGGADKVLCGANGTTSGESVALADWTLTVGGDVDNAFTATLADLADEDSLTVTMGCSCAGNPADGRATANAEVTGVTFEEIYKTAGVAEDANTVTFVSADGYSVALPLAYVAQRYTLLVYNVNGAPLEDSMGGTNQLWLGSTSARYFARDIVEIDFSHEDVVPAAPGSLAAEGNTPNVTLLG